MKRHQLTSETRLGTKPERAINGLPLEAASKEIPRRCNKQDMGGRLRYLGTALLGAGREFSSHQISQEKETLTDKN